MKRKIQSLCHRVKNFGQDLGTSFWGQQLVKQSRRCPLDFRISYPSYVPMDDFIDWEHLKSIDLDIKVGIAKYISYQQSKSHYVEDLFTTGCMKLNIFDSQKSSPRLIRLTQHTGVFDYFDLNQEKHWKPSLYADFFPSLMSFIKTLPFEQTGRIMLIFDLGSKGSAAHKDHSCANICHHFLWLRSNKQKKFYVLNEQSNIKKHIKSYSAWFDTVNQFHGESPSEGLSFSIRVDGVFNESIRKLLPVMTTNQASTAALFEVIRASDVEKESLSLEFIEG